jgi:hypothetical protein
MKQLVCVLALVALGVAMAAPDAPLNQLTPQEKADGWQLLFDGKTLDKWVFSGEGQWKVVDGTMTPGAGRGYPATKEDFDNFQLRFEFRPGIPNINSGVYIRRGRVAGDSHTLGYELQIRNPGPKDAPYDGKPDNHNGYYTGSFSGHLKSKNEPTVVVGKWHSVDLTANGDHFIVVIDGQKVLDARHSEFKTGLIGFQPGREGTIDLRNIRIKKL